ncbi:MAG: GNAT family N-acetyltransferase [Rhodovibrionaceae bacterium]|nr:GNAT family N-acetyltransferase [Rhodovibrionaceae bacterium]
MTGKSNIRPGNIRDAPLIARLANEAAEGMPLHLWRAMGEPGQDPWQVGIRRAGSEDAKISYRNAWIAEVDGRSVGCLIAYRQPASCEAIPEDTPAIFLPLLELEREAPGTGYVYVLCTLPEARGMGIGTSLLQFAERYRGPRGMSLIVSDANLGARRLYERCGYRAVASRPMVKNGWQNPGTAWMLMIKTGA